MLISKKDKKFTTFRCRHKVDPHLSIADICLLNLAFRKADTRNDSN